MADLAASDVSYTGLKIKKIEDNRKIVDATISFGDGVKTYPAGGIPLQKKMLDCPVVLDAFLIDDMNSASSQLIKHDALNNKLRIYNVSSVSLSPSPPAGSPPMGTVPTFAVLGASAVSNTGVSVLKGDLGIYPNGASSVTGFPPGVYTGTLHAADTAAQVAQASALASYNDLAARPTTVIPSALDGQTLTAGGYSFASGAATLAQSGNGTLTLSGSATDIIWIKTASTLTTGAGGIPTILLTGGLLASNVYWVVGSSATINAGSAGTFQGSILANTSVTDTLGGTVNGSLVALTGAVTLSAATLVNAVTILPSGVEMSGAVAATSIKVLAIGY